MSGKVDGILIGEGFVASHYIERLAARVPVVVIAGTPGERAADVVAADNFSGSAAIITHLIADHGKRRLFHVDGPPNSPDAGQRRLALEHVLRGHPQCQLIGSTQGIFSVRSGEQAGENLLARYRAGAAGRGRVRQRPDGDRGAAGPSPRAACGSPRRWPWSASTTSSSAACTIPTLTTVHQPMRMLGEQACARATDRIADPDLCPTVELLPTELVLRSSCGCPPGR